MKKLFATLALAIILALVIGMSVGLLSEAGFDELYDDCYSFKRDSCQRLIDRGLPSVEECDEDTCLKIAMIYHRLEDYHQDFKYSRKVCYEFNNGEGCASLAHLYDHGRGVEQDKAKAAEYGDKACMLNDAHSCFVLGADYKSKEDFAKAKYYWEKGCDELNNADSCSALGLLYEEGLGVKQDIKKTMIYYSKACELTNNGYICYYLGNLLKGVKNTFLPWTRAGYYARACELNKVDACRRLGYIYELGEGEKKDTVRAIEYYEKGCELDDALSCVDLGIIYASGDGVRQDFAKTRQYYEKACGELDNSSACWALGNFYEEGRNGFKQNKSVAKEYYGKACDMGNKGGCDNYRKLNEQGIR